MWNSSIKKVYEMSNKPKEKEKTDISSFATNIDTRLKKMLKANNDLMEKVENEHKERDE